MYSSSMMLYNYCTYNCCETLMIRCETCGYRYHQRCSPGVPIRCSYVDEDIFYATWVHLYFSSCFSGFWHVYISTLPVFHLVHMYMCILQWWEILCTQIQCTSILYACTCTCTRTYMRTYMYTHTHTLDHRILSGQNTPTAVLHPSSSTSALPRSNNITPYSLILSDKIQPLRSDSPPDQQQAPVPAGPATTLQQHRYSMDPGVPEAYKIL